MRITTKSLAWIRRGVFALGIGLLLCSTGLPSKWVNDWRQAAAARAIEQANHQRGRERAEQQIAEGFLRIEVGGIPGRSFGSYSSLVNRRIHVDMRLTGCMSTMDERQEQKGYNERMREEIDHRFGPGILDSLAAENQATATE